MSVYTTGVFKEKIDQIKFNTILEIGSMHGLDSIALLKTYKPERVITVECNPEGIELCKKNLTGYPNITLIEVAAWNENTELQFYRVTESYDHLGRPSHKTDMHQCNIGASSCFKDNGTWPWESYVQQEIKVKGRRLDGVLKEHNISQVDLICMDVQGAALQALQGLGDYLVNTKAIISELETAPIYHNQSLYQEVSKYLELYNFYTAYKNNWSKTSNDYLFLKKDL